VGGVLICQRRSEAYRDIIISLITTIEEKEKEPIEEAADILAKAVADDRLINYYWFRRVTLTWQPKKHFTVQEVSAAVNPLLDAGTNLIHGALRSTFVERTPGYAKAVLDAYGT